MTTNMKSKQLEILLNDFKLMSETVLLQMQIVSKLIKDNNAIGFLMDEAQENEIILDRLDIKIREEVVFTILQFNPIASDLRKIITYQDITINLERVGDMLYNIMRILTETDLQQSQFGRIKKMLIGMLDQSNDMLKNAIFSFSHKDTAIAYKVIKDDDKVDQLLCEIRLSLQETFAGKTIQKEDIQQMMNISTIAHNLERIGDSATNISESTIYLTDGKDIRHAGN